MAREIRIGSAVIDPDTMERMIAQEWQERRPTQDTPGGFAPSAAFGEQAQRLQALRARLNDELSGQMGNGQTIDPQRITDLKILERLCFHAETDPQGQRRRAGDRLMDQGKSPHHGGLLNSERYRLYAEASAKPGRGDPQITIDHGV